MIKKINFSVTQVTEYGSYTPAFFERSTRFDLWKSERCPEGVMESVRAISNLDLSPVRTGSPTARERINCYCCFAGYAHTTALCEERQSSATN